MNMSQETPPRKRAFKVALAQLDMTAKAFCEQQGISQVQLYAVLGGKRESARLTAAIDALIATAEQAA
jgi:predicted transcriptional regulator